MSLATAENGDVTLSEARHSVCLEAAWEVEAIALMLPDAVDLTDEYSMQSRLRIRCMAGRLREIANALMAGLNDDAVSVAGINGLNQRVLMCD